MDYDAVDTCFTGVAEHTLDAKGRVSLPVKARRNLPDSLKVVLSPENDSVYVFSPQEYDVWFKQFFPNGFNPLSKRDTKLKMRLLAFTEDVDIDSAGRIGIPAKLRSVAHLEKDVAIIGGGRYLEIRDRAAYSELEDDLLSMDFMED